MTHTSLRIPLVVAVALVTTFAIVPEEIAEARVIKTDWGRVVQCRQTGDLGNVWVTKPVASGRLALPTPFPNIAAAHSAAGPVVVEFNKDASQIDLHVKGAGEPKAGDKAPAVQLDLAENTTQFPDGRIVFSALDAKVVGDTAKLESHPGNHRIGFWTDANDFVKWDYNASRWGMYSVELTYSTAAPDGSEVEVAMGGKTLKTTLTSTGSWYRYTTVSLGKLYLEKAGKQTLTVKCAKKVGGAVMNLKAVILRPACEGTPPVQAKDGSILLHAKDVTIKGVKLRWEPAEKKRTVGFWANEADRAMWEFTVKQAGTFDIEILQGCGKGHGGSVAAFRFTGEAVKDGKHKVTIQDTGHWQNFIPRTIGRVTIEKPGQYQLMVTPIEKARGAVMDLRQVKLTPVK